MSNLFYSLETLSYIDLYIIYVLSIITFALYGFDKHLAYRKKTRIPEFVLLMFAFLGGAFGALCAMIFFRHKTLHKLFTISIPIFLFIQLSLVVLYRMSII